MLVLLLFISFTFANIGEAVIEGTVGSTEDGTPLTGANVVLFESNKNRYGATTDGSGFFRIENVESGTYNINISFIGFDDYREDVYIEKGKQYKIDVSLMIQPIKMTSLEIISDAIMPYDNLPGSATVMDIKTIKLVNPIGTQEMLEYVPGINGFADDGIGNSRISIGIRGINPRRSSRVLILEDGIPIQPALYVYPNMYYNPPADRIDQIEVIKGSGSVLYGPQTMGGVINYFTKRPRENFGGTVKLTAGENFYNSLFFDIGGWGTDKLKSDIQILAKRGNGFRQNNDFEQINTTLKLGYFNSPTKNTYLKLNLNHENSNATYTGLTQFSFDNQPWFNPKEHDNFNVFRAALDVIQSERISSKISKNTKAYLSYFDRKWWRENDIFVKADLDSLTGIVSLGDSKKDWYYASIYDLARTGNGQDNFGILRAFYVLGLERSYKIRHKLFLFGKYNESMMEIGARLYWERFIDDRKTGDSPNSRDGIYFIPSENIDDSPTIVGQSHHYETTALSAYLSETIKLGSVEVRPGFRFELFEQERIDRLAGSLYQDKTIFVVLPGVGLSKNIGSINIFGGIHRGFTPPSSGALKILNFGEGLEDTGLDLEAEKSWNRELGIRGNLHWMSYSDKNSWANIFELIDFEISIFNVDIENLVAAGRGTAFTNLGKVNSRGIETRINILFSEFNVFYPNINLTHSYLDTRVKDATLPSVSDPINISGNRLPYAPQDTYTIGIEHQLLSEIKFRIDYRYVGEVYTDFENTESGEDEIGESLGISGPVPDYALWSASGSYQLSSQFKFFLSAKNITDEIYIGSRLHSNPGQPDANISSGILPGPRRQINIGFEYNF